MSSHEGMDFPVNKFLSFWVDQQSEDENTLHFKMRDGGEGLVDIDFSEDGYRMDVTEEIMVESPYCTELINAFQGAMGVGDWLEHIQVANIHITNWSGSPTKDKGLFVHGSKQPITELGNLVEQAVMYGYYMSITPTQGLSEEYKERGDIIVMFDDRRLVQR